jgi:hypothetical protein
MATEQQARRARDVHQDKLLAAGAHGISVLPVAGQAGKRARSFSVVAFIDCKAQKKPVSLPSTLPIVEGGKTVNVPLVVRDSKPFQPE